MSAHAPDDPFSRALAEARRRVPLEPRPAPMPMPELAPCPVCTGRGADPDGSPCRRCAGCGVVGQPSDDAAVPTDPSL